MNNLSLLIFSIRLRLLYKSNKTRLYSVLLPEILYAIYKCRLYSVRLPENLYAIYKYRFFSVQSRLFHTIIRSCTFDITRFFCRSVRLFATSR